MPNVVLYSVRYFIADVLYPFQKICKMHELLLFGQIPASRHDQVLNILAGVAGMQPVPVLEKHLVFKPNRLPASARPVQVGGAQDIQKSQVQALQAQNQGDLFYMQLVAEAFDGDIKARVDGLDEIMLDATKVYITPFSLRTCR